MNIQKIYFFLLAGLLFLQGNAQVSLCYKLKKNDVFKVQQHSMQVITQEILGNKQEVTNNIVGTMNFTVKEVLDDSYEIEMVFLDLKLSMRSSELGEMVKIDATASNEDPQAKVFNGLINYPITIKMKTNGDILSVENSDSLIENMLTSADIKDEFIRELMKTSLEKEYGSKALSESYKQMTFFYPDKEVKVNDRWENTYTGQLSANSTWKLHSVDSIEAVITGKAKVKMNLEEPDVSMVLEGTQETKLITNLKNGFLKEMVVEAFAKGSSKISQIGDKDIPTTIKSKITYNLIK
ncbi:hypothetical protein GWK08_00920 [Leptobacterium flavescens]|uniref:Uncharacterized protein n=1 Tax=Leptobacterium flavescens TaxID=472055 RepID=A0A6P0UJF8_9FLAO|nr:DUF6263 family protein [Leptobacterium flavescens]NER11989.1 hypothetical protein [Leptobacterium flavescens]